MYNYGSIGHKTSGMTTAQTPSERPHRVPSYKFTVQGAGETAANQPRTERDIRTSGGSQHV